MPRFETPCLQMTVFQMVITVAHWLICLLNHFMTYFHAPGVKQGVKRSGNLQGSRNCRFGPLIFSQNWRIFKNVQNSTQNHCFWAVFRSLFNFGWKTVHQTKKFEFPEGFCFLWCPCCPQTRDNNGAIISFMFCFEILWWKRPLVFFLLFFKMKPDVI